MSRRVKLSAVIVLATGALSAPPIALAGTGGAGLMGANALSGGSGVATDVVETATGDGITFSSHSAALLRGQMRFTGTVSRPARGKKVEIQRIAFQPGSAWVTTATAPVASNGSFTAVWRVSQTGTFAFRAVVVGRAHSATAATSTVTVVVFRPAVATIYGPGFWNRRTACGQRLRRTTVGVANRTLPCGARVAVYYRGKALVVPVIDRGPYANGATWDLTEAAAHELGITGTERVGTIRVQ